MIVKSKQIHWIYSARMTEYVRIAFDDVLMKKAVWEKGSYSKEDLESDPYYVEDCDEDENNQMTEDDNF